MSATLMPSSSIPPTREWALLRNMLKAASGFREAGESAFSHYRRVVLACVLPWTLVSFIGFAQDLSRRLYWDDPTPLQDAWFWGVRILLWALLTPIVLWLGGRWPMQRGWRIALHCLFAICFALARAGIEVAIAYSFNQWGVIGPLEWLEELGNAIANAMIFGLHGAFFAYWVILSVQAMLQYYAKFREREQEAVRLRVRTVELGAQVMRAQLGALKMQLQPHFLFNTLNAIVVLVRQQKLEQAEEGLTRFSDLLRAVLDDLEVQEVPLAKELDYLRLYLAIEQMRFSDRLKVNILADPDVLDAAVPHMGVQPIVENAVRHGISGHKGAGTIEIRALKIGESLHVTVRDDGPGVAHSAFAGHGMGLTNLRARLQQLYADEAQVQIANADPQGAIVTIILPFRRLEESDTVAYSGLAAGEPVR